LRHGDFALSCTFSPDGRRLATTCADGIARVWDATSGKRLLALRTENGTDACAFSPDGGRLATASVFGYLQVWNSFSGQLQLVLEAHGGSRHAFAFSPDGRYLTSIASRHHNDNAELRLVNASTGDTVLTFSGHEGVHACAFSPDGRRLVSGDRWGILRLWDAETGERLRVWVAHRGRMDACAFSPDGQRLASAGADGTLKLWDLSTGACVRVHAISDNMGHAVWLPRANKVVEATSQAWRWLGWQAVDDAGEATRLPLETFGPVKRLHTL
jgi:WD40 repeat protein